MHKWRVAAGTATATAMLAFTFTITSGTIPALADEAGVSFWLPGQYGSLAAVPHGPGWSLPVVYYHSSVDLSGSKPIEIGGEIAASIEADANLAAAIPTYTFEEPVLGGELALSVAGFAGRIDVSGEVSVGPFSVSREDSVFGIGDLYPTAAIRWNNGTSNFMTYAAAGIPIGAYELGRLANISSNHWSIDGGVGYTYFDPSKGHEFSAVAGLTYNFENPETDYQNGIDFHLDWGASQFLSEQTHVGLVGYFYQQLTGDSGDGAVLGDFKSSVISVGPQFGYFFPMNGEKAYLNLKGYYEFDAENRPSGWNGWVTLAVPLGG